MINCVRVFRHSNDLYYQNDRDHFQTSALLTWLPGGGTGNSKLTNVRDVWHLFTSQAYIIGCKGQYGKWFFVLIVSNRKDERLCRFKRNSFVTVMLYIMKMLSTKNPICSNMVGNYYYTFGIYLSNQSDKTSWQK